MPINGSATHHQNVAKMFCGKNGQWNKIICLSLTVLLVGCGTVVQPTYSYENSTFRNSVTVAFLDDGVKDTDKELFAQVITVDNQGEGGEHGQLVYNAFTQSFHYTEEDIALIAIDVVGENSQVTPENLAKGINVAHQHGAHFINISISFPDNFLAIYEAVKDACKAGITIFASTANDVFDRKSYPAHYPEVYGVTLLNNDGSPADLATTMSADVGIYTKHIPQAEQIGTSLATPVALACYIKKPHSFPRLSQNKGDTKIIDCA